MIKVGQIIFDRAYEKTLEEVNHFLTYKSTDALIDFIKTLKK